MANGMCSCAQGARGVFGRFRVKRCPTPILPFLVGFWLVLPLLSSNALAAKAPYVWTPGAYASPIFSDSPDIFCEKNMPQISESEPIIGTTSYTITYTTNTTSYLEHGPNGWYSFAVGDPMA